MAEEETKKQEKIEEKKEMKMEEKKTEAKVETKSEKKEEKAEKRQEKEFIIPLRKTFRNTVIYKRTPKAIRTIKEFLLRHMKFYDGNLNSVKIDRYLNEFIWARSIRNPPAKVKIKAFVDGDFIRAELAEFPESLKFKKQRMENREKKAETEKGKKKESEKTEEVKEKTEEEKKEEKEKKSAVVEAGKQMEKTTAKQAKHQVKGAPKQQKTQPRRMALQK
ncbi:MAG: hypothetical protein ABSG05_01420 [Candidatus Pacearchaeota archaeon]|jgi:large subunit ribosomal protein L31e